MKKNENKNHIDTDESNLNKETHVCMLFLTEIQGVEEGVKPHIYRFCSQVLYLPAEIYETGAVIVLIT